MSMVNAIEQWFKVCVAVVTVEIPFPSLLVVAVAPAELVSYPE